MEKSTAGVKMEWVSVPAFGEWEKQKGMPDYSMDFSKIREMRKQNKSDCTGISIGNDDDLFTHSNNASAVASGVSSVPPSIHRQHSPSGRKNFKSYFACCIRA